MTRAIRVETSRIRARGAASRWRIQYGNEPKDPRWAQVLSELDALEQPTPEQVEAIIGNTSWTREHCDVCEREAEKWVVLGDEENRCVYACIRCLRDATLTLAEMGS